MELVLIPAGEFMMGSREDEVDRSGNEVPQHRVRITRPFYMGKYEVTQAQYQAVMGRNPSIWKSSSLPVENVSWSEATRFCNKLSVRAGKQLRLPKEAEWEYVCRAGSTTRFCFGDTDGGLGGYAWYHDNAGRKAHSVGEKRPNAWGLHDMHGNVYEWCVDWYDEDYYAKSPGEDPGGPGTASCRVLRGGSWRSYASDCRSTRRLGFVPSARRTDFGFRVAVAAAGR